MPVILPEKDYHRWLHIEDPDRPPVDLLRPYDANALRAWKVDKRVGSVKNDAPDLIEEVSSIAEPDPVSSRDPRLSLFEL